MTPRTRICDLSERLGERVRLCGWIEATPERPHDGFRLADRTGVVAVAPARATSQPRSPLLTGSAVEVLGTVTGAGPEAQGVEVLSDDVRVVGPAFAESPLGPDSSLDERSQWRFLDLRRPENHLIFEVQTALERAMREIWAEQDFFELHSPKLRPDANRSGAELFRLQYFGRPAYLAQSPQFSKQMAMASGFERVFEIAPVFRANPLTTDRHDTEFTSIDVEMSWIGSHEDVMAFEEHLLARSIAVVKAEYGQRIRELFGTDIQVPEVPFPRMSLDDARAVAAKAGHVSTKDNDIDVVAESLLASHVRREYGHEFVFVTEYPAVVRPFYHMLLTEGSSRTRGFDLLWKGIEVTTGAQREHRYDVLTAQVAARGILVEATQPYLDFFKFGCPPHGGFGIGLTRLLMCLFGTGSVREVTFLHRSRTWLRP